MQDISKLPKWAQAEITRLENSVEYHKDRLRESIPEGEGKSDTIVYMGFGEEHVGLPNGTPIRFQTEAGVIEVRSKGEFVEVTTIGGAIRISPHVSNVIQLEVKPR